MPSQADAEGQRNLTENLIDVRVTATRFEALRINSFELRPCEGELLPEFSAGSHIDVHLPSGTMRNYSLVNSPAERHRYVFAVSHDTASRAVALPVRAFARRTDDKD